MERTYNNRNEYNKQWRHRNKRHCQEYARRYYRSKIEKDPEYYNRWYRELDNENKKSFYKRGLTKRKIWGLKNKDKQREYNRKYYYRKTKKDNSYRLSRNVSRAIRGAVAGGKDGRRWEELVGYTRAELVEHLEKQFDEKMSWDNYGSYWHIDHIVPKSSFKFNCYEDESFRRCWSLNNLQPLEAKENIRKGNRF